MKNFAKILLIVCLISIKAIATPKPFAQKNAKWYYQEFLFELTFTEVYTCTGDTIINGTTCSLIKADTNEYHSLSNLPRHVICIYKDSNAVFAWDDSIAKFVKVFDYSLKTKDSFKVTFNKTKYKYNVLKVDTILINKQAIKEWNFGNIIFNNYFGGNDQVLPFLNNYIYHDQGLNCFEDSTLGHYIAKSYPVCDYKHSGIDPAKNTYSQIQLYPNPAHGNFRISSPDIINPIQMSISDVYGKTINIYQLNNISEGYNIDISTLPAGLYILHIDQAGIQYSKKLLIQ